MNFAFTVELIKNEFPKKRTRGEWFKLKLSDIKIIRDHMKDYK